MFLPFLYPVALLPAYGLFFSFALASSNNSAWNGQLTSGSTAKQSEHFQPYFVPSGAKAYTSEDRHVSYSGVWNLVYSKNLPNGVSRFSTDRNATIYCPFKARAFEFFGSIGPKEGCSRIYLDGKHIETIRYQSNSTRHGQRLYSTYDLDGTKKHLVKVVNCGYTSFSAFVVTKGPNDLGPSLPRSSSVSSKTTSPRDLSRVGWKLVQKGSTGVNAMQLTVLSPDYALIVDKVEHNPLEINGHPAWATLYNMHDHSLLPLPMKSNSFCASGTFLRNGSLIMVGGNPVVEDHTGAADFGDTNGLQSIRMMKPCSTNGCTPGVYEDPNALHLATPRWYATAIRLDDGSSMVIGGSSKGGWINNKTVNNPTIEYYPPKNIHRSNGNPIRLPFLDNTLPSNLFPMAILLPDGTIFIAANQDAMIYNWKTNTERPLPRIPNGVRVTYPMTGCGVLLPLSPENDYTPEVLICGGSTMDDSLPSYRMSSQHPASSQCVRMVLTDSGIRDGWKVEHMPEGRIMPDIVALPTGQYVILNGAGSGIAGYGNVQGQVGRSNADHPRLTPVLYDPKGQPGHRFRTEGMPGSVIPRLYHSTATLAPDGSIMIAGSNPNLDRSEEMYGTEYRVEWLSPPYMSGPRPQLGGGMSIKNVMYGEKFELRVELSDEGQDQPVEVLLMEFGYVTHSVPANSRIVHLVTHLKHQGLLEVSGPPHEGIYPPGPGWLCVVAGGIPSKMIQIMVGSGEDPPFDGAALAKSSSPPTTSTGVDDAE